MFKNPIKPQDPSRRLGYQTYYNNFLTQVFLKVRVIFAILLFSAGASIAIPFFFNNKLTPAISVLFSVIRFYGIGIFTKPGNGYFFEYLKALGNVVETSLLWAILLFIVIFPTTFYYLKWSADKAYKKKYIRGIEILPMKILIKQLNKEN